MEFSGELSDFIMRDVRERYSTHVKDYIQVTLIEVSLQFFAISSSKSCTNMLIPTLSSNFVLEQANEILSSFEVGLRQYATNHLTKVIEMHSCIF